jgi:hypothetical protein
MHSWGPFYPPFISLAILLTMGWVLIGPIVAVWARDLRLVALLPVATGASASAWVAVHNRHLAATAGPATLAANASEAMVLLMVAFVAAAIVSFILAVLPYRNERVRRVPIAPYLILATLIVVAAAYFYPVVCFSALILIAVLTIAGFFLPSRAGADVRVWLFAMTVVSLIGIVVTYTAHNYFMRIATGGF